MAILDDLSAIVVIALFYTADLSLASLAIGAVGAAVLVVMNLLGVVRIAPCLLIGLVMWVCVLKSGVHATLAGVVTALTIPLRVRNFEAQPPLRRLEEALHPWVVFGVMPIFAFANAGVALGNISAADRRTDSAGHRLGPLSRQTGRRPLRFDLVGGAVPAACVSKVGIQMTWIWALYVF